MYTIHLHRLYFETCHGLYPEEMTTPQPFEVDVKVEADLPSKVTLIEQTIDYAEVYKVVDRCMQKPTQLLETLALEMADAIKAFDSRITHVSISIRKLKPPIENFQGYVELSFQKSYS